MGWAPSLVATAILGLGPSTLLGQSTPPADTTVDVVPGSRYAAGRIFEFFWGVHYRPAWTTSIQVPVLNLNTFAGGLEPIRRGGGRQTKSLRLQGRDGKEYSFRSIDKDPAAAIPEYLRSPLAAGILQDQISSQHPVGPLMSDPLQDAAGVLHANPSLFVMPDDPALGEHRAEFADLLGLIEERPDENADSVAAFAGARSVIGSERLFERVRESPEDRVNARAFLNARLLDIYLGDWDRHADQWRWASFGSDSVRGWQPIPRDRDQVFAKLDGFFPSLAHMFTPELVSFGPKYPSMMGLHWTARLLDRQFLVDLERPVWDSLSTVLATRFTDSVIDGAIGALPPELYALNGEWLRESLRRRRDNLGTASSDLYELLARTVDIQATDEDELAEITRYGADSLEIAISLRDQPDDPYFRRRFDAAESKEIRLHLHRGDDRVVVRGDGSASSLVRVIGGRGDDEFDFETTTGRIRLYDSRGDNEITGTPPRGVRLDTKRYRRERLEEQARLAPRDWGHSLLFAMDLGYSQDYGLLLGVGFTHVDFGFRKDPSASRITPLIAATTKGKFDFRFNSEFWFENSPGFATFTAYATQLDVLHYYGPGNDSPDNGNNEFYNVDRTYVHVEPGLSRVFGSHGRVLLGIPFRFSRTAANEGRFISTIPDLYGTGDFTSMGAHAGLDWDSRSRENHLSTGVAVFVDGWVFPTLWDVESTYGGITAEFMADWETPLPVLTVLAGRVGTMRVWGRFPYFDSAFLGGSENVRGWRSQRFAGDLSIYGNAEVRTHLFDINVLIPQMFGIMLLGDIGRVYVDRQTPGGWHTAFGGGVWTGILGPKNVASASLVNSDQGVGFYFGWGFEY